MSEIRGDAHRARRRAVRSAGPPVEGADAVTEMAVDAARLGGEETAGRAKDAASSVQAKGTDSARKAKPADSSGEAKDAGSAEAVEKADTLALTKDEPKDGDAADLVNASAGVESGDAPSVDLGKAGAETTSDETSGSTDSDDTGAGSRSDRLGVERIVVLAVAAVLVLALVGGAIASVFVARSAAERDERRTAYVQTARQAILNLTTIRADSAKEDIDRILSMASGQFKTEFDGRVDPFLSIVQQAKVVSNGEIVEAALESDADDSAKVLVAAKQTLTNAGQAEPQTRFYRFRVTVTRTDSGLSASNVEFVA
ncbi:hypothetical protein [Nocardia xishanensis]|uniref:hypothetical protein n=1 Tax=Nocardia xishanensis TaxID=238964 RepID=UPI000AEF7FD9|nr:hypothetical protein [Nocardia xishanensis]